MTTITDLADVREGDIVTVSVDGRTLLPDVCYNRLSAPGALWVYGHVLRGRDGAPGPRARFVSAERPAPRFPTEPGTPVLIHATTTEAYDPPRLAILDSEGDPSYGTDEWSYAANVTAWQAVSVKPEGEVHHV